MEGMHSGEMMELMDGMLEHMGEMMAEMHGEHQENAGEAHAEHAQLQMMGSAAESGADGAMMGFMQQMNGEMQRMLPAMESMLKHMRDYRAEHGGNAMRDSEMETMMVSLDKMMGSGQTIMTTLRGMNGSAESGGAPAAEHPSEHPHDHQH